MSICAATASPPNDATSAAASYRYARTHDEKILFPPDHLVKLVHDQLSAENLLAVFDPHTAGRDIFFQRGELFVLFEQAQNVYIFARGEFHGGQHDQTVFLTRSNRRGTVFTRVMVGKRDRVQPFDKRHVDDVVGRVVVVAARAQTRMNVKIVIDIHTPHASKSIFAV